MTSPALTNIPNRTPDQARSERMAHYRADFDDYGEFCIRCGSGRIVSRHDYQSDRDALLQAARAHHALVEALEDCAGCITAAETEGLYELIAALEGRGNEQIDRLIDLIERRLLYVKNYTDAALALARKGGGE